MIATDGVFSMDGHVAPLERICELAEQHDALVMVDDSPAVGFIGGASQLGCLESGGRILCESNVPVENVGGAGTAGAHWRETTFGNELMTEERG